MTDKITMRARWGRLNALFGGHAGSFVAVLIAAIVLLSIVLALSGCGPNSSTVSPAAKASASSMASAQRSAAAAIAKGQAAQRAEGIVRACFAKNTGHITGIIRCAIPKGHKAAFEKCAFAAVGADIPGQEARFETTDLPNCIVNNR